MGSTYIGTAIDERTSFDRLDESPHREGHDRHRTECTVRCERGHVGRCSHHQAWRDARLVGLGAVTTLTTEAAAYRHKNLMEDFDRRGKPSDARASTSGASTRRPLDHGTGDHGDGRALVQAGISKALGASNWETIASRCRPLPAAQEIASLVVREIVWSPREPAREELA
jgi:hypothetical protein